MYKRERVSTYVEIACAWTEEETLKLIAVWSEGAIQAMLEGSRRNRDVYVKISREMEEAGYSRTAKQCSSKIKKLRFEYRKIRDKHGKTGEGRKDWRFYEAMDEVLGHKPATQPPVVVKSSDAAENTVDEDSLESEEASSLLVANESSRSLSETPVAEVEKTPAKEKSRKRKKPSDRYERMDAVVDKMMKMQADSDSHYLKLEEKMMEMEERRRKESQEFQMRMMALLCGPAAAASPASGSRQQGPAYMPPSSGSRQQGPAYMPPSPASGSRQQGPAYMPPSPASGSRQEDPAYMHHPMYSFEQPSPNDDENDY